MLYEVDFFSMVIGAAFLLVILTLFELLEEVITTRLNNKDSRISFRVSKEFDNWITDRAALSGMSVSDYVRYVLEDFRRSVQIAEKLSEVLDNGNESTSIDN